MSCPLCKSGNRFMLRRPETGSTHNCTIRFKTELCPKSEIQIPAFLSVSVIVAQLCPTHCDPMDWGLPGSSIHGIFQARILEWIAIPFSRGSSQPRDHISSIRQGNNAYHSLRGLDNKMYAEHLASYLAHSRR